MYLDDFVARDFLQELFDAIKDRSMAQMPAGVDFDLRFSNENDLRIFAIIVSASEGEWRFSVVVTERLLQYITRYFSPSRGLFRRYLAFRSRIPAPAVFLTHGFLRSKVSKLFSTKFPTMLN